MGAIALVCVNDVAVLVDEVAIAAHEEAGGHETLHPDRAPRMNARC